MVKKNSSVKTAYQREEEPGFMEKIGVKYYRFLTRKSGTADLENIDIDKLAPDTTLQTLASNITAFAAVIGFAIGALTTFVTIWVEWTYQASMETVPYYLLYGGNVGLDAGAGNVGIVLAGLENRIQPGLSDRP